MKKALVFPIIATIILANIYIFFNHYFREMGIPYDFLQSYHAIPYYWIELVKLGEATSWVPFQGMGYPLHMNIQSGFYYPPFWLFVLFQKTYTLHAAVIMQAGHVLFGGIGALFLSRCLGLSWGNALVAGIAFQSFGAFYSNASHPDIVRTYAYTPWLFAPVFLNIRYQSKLAKTALVITPLLLFCFITGGYLGGSIATCFILAITIVTRMIFEKSFRRYGMYLLLFFISGCMLTGIYLLPAVIEKEQIARSAEIGKMVYQYMDLKDCFALIFPIGNSYFSHDITMRSIFVGIPIVALFLAGIKYIHQTNRWVIIAFLLSLAMVSGFLHQYLILIFGFLGYSRFIYADYRGIVCLLFILISLQSVEFIKRNGPSLIPLLLGLSNFILWGAYLTASEQPGDKLNLGIMLTIGLISVVLILHKNITPKLLLISFAFLIVCDWTRVIKDQPYWNFGGATAWVEAVVGKFKTTHPQLLSRIQNSANQRPSRNDITEAEIIKGPWKGYYTGEYMMEDYSGPTKLVRQQRVYNSPSLRNFAQQEWQARSIPTKLTKSQPESYINYSHAEVTILDYGLDTIKYSVNLDKQTTVIENEIFWNGWSALLIDPSGSLIDQIIPTERDGFRQWSLPSGKYKMIAHFITPNYKWGFTLTALGFLLWLCTTYIFVRRNRSFVS